MAVFKVAEVEMQLSSVRHFVSVVVTVNTKFLKIDDCFLKRVRLNNLKSFEKAVSYQLTYRLWHILPALLVKVTLKMYTFCIKDQRDLFILA